MIFNFRFAFFLVLAFCTVRISVLAQSGVCFASPNDYSFSISPYVWSDNPSLVVDDFNGDGILDLASDEVLLSDGKGAFYVGSVIGYNSSAIASGDFNADGKKDIAMASYLGNSVSILIGKGNGSFLPGVGYSIGNHPKSIAVSDLNGDGKLDLAVAAEGD